MPRSARWKNVSVSVCSASISTSKPGSSYCAIAYATPGCVNRSRASVTGSSATRFCKPSSGLVEWKETLHIAYPATTSRLAEEPAVYVDVWCQPPLGAPMMLMGSQRTPLASLSSSKGSKNNNDDEDDDDDVDGVEIAPGITLRARASAKDARANAGVEKSYAVQVVRARGLQFVRRALHIEIHVGGEKRFQTPECVNGRKSCVEALF